MSLRTKRVHAYNRQNGRCYYCQWPMWERAFKPQDHALKRITALRSHKTDPVTNLLSFECTAEHLQRRADGGADAGFNIAAACLDCNSARAQVASADWQTTRIAANQYDQAGQDKGFDAAFYEIPDLTQQYRFKWHHNFFVELPRWQVEVEAMKLGDFSTVGNRYQTADSISLVYPVFADEYDLLDPTRYSRSATLSPVHRSCWKMPHMQPCCAQHSQTQS